MLYQFIKRNIKGVFIISIIVIGVMVILTLCEFLLQYFFENKLSLVPNLSLNEIINTFFLLGGIILIIEYDYYSIIRSELNARQKSYFFKKLFMPEGSLSDVKRDYFLYNFNESVIHRNAFKEMNLKAFKRVESLRFVMQTFISRITIPFVILFILFGYQSKTLPFSFYWGIALVFLLYVFRKHYIDRVLFPAKMFEEIRNVKDLFNSKNWVEDLNINDEVYFENYWLINTTLTPIEKLKHFENIMDVICDYDYNLIKEKCFIKVGSKYKVIPIRQGQDAPTLIALLSAFEELDFFPKFINKNKILIPDTIIHKWLKIKFEFKEYPTDSPFRSDTIIKRLDSTPNRDYKKLVISIIKEGKIK